MERGSICLFLIYGNGKLHGSEIKHSVRRRLVSVCVCRATVMFCERQNKYESCAMKKVNNVLGVFFRAPIIIIIIIILQ